MFSSTCPSVPHTLVDGVFQRWSNHGALYLNVRSGGGVCGHDLTWYLSPVLSFCLLAVMIWAAFFHSDPPSMQFLCVSLWQWTNTSELWAKINVSSFNLLVLSNEMRKVTQTIPSYLGLCSPTASLASKDPKLGLHIQAARRGQCRLCYTRGSGISPGSRQLPWASRLCLCFGSCHSN